MSRLGRFLHLERPRAETGAAAEPSGASADRFAGVERPGAPPRDPPSSGATLERFGAEPPDAPLELDDWRRAAPPAAEGPREVEGDPAARRAMGEALAREIGERERRRLDRELGGWGERLLAALFRRRR